jgi:hypothetical protein
MAVADYAASVGLPDIERRTATTEYEFQRGATEMMARGRARAGPIRSRSAAAEMGITATGRRVCDRPSRR